MYINIKITSGQPIEVEIEPPMYSGKFESSLSEEKKAMVKTNQANKQPTKYIIKNVVKFMVIIYMYILFLNGELVKINEKLIQRPISIYDFHEDIGYFVISFFEKESTAIILDIKNEKKISYVKILTNDNKIGWVRSVYLKKINLYDV